MSLLTTRNTYVYKNIRLYFYFRRWYLCGAEKQSQGVRAHGGAVGRRESLWTTDFSRNSGTYIVYNSHVTGSNSSFSLTMVMPTSHFFAFHWLCCLLPIGYLPKPGSVGVRICHNHRIQPRPQVKVIFRYLRPDAPVSTSTVFIAPVNMMTFRWSHRSYQSICQQHPPYSHPQVTLIYYIITIATLQNKH